MLTHYNSSKGPLEIATMPLSYARNARKKLQVNEPERTAEIEALSAHVEALEAAATAKALEGDPAPREAVMGDNGGPPIDEPAPALSGREAIEAHVADLLSEAANWADGFVIENQEQADAVGRLLRKLQQAAKLVDDAAADEKRPLNDAIAKIAEWQNSYTSKGKKTIPDGKLTKAMLAVGNMSTAWLRKLDDERWEREKEAAEAAAKAAQEAIAAREEAKVSTDLAAMDKAEDLLSGAKALIKQAEGVAKERVAVGGGDGTRALGLRSHWSAKVENYALAYSHYKQNPEFMADFHALIDRWADRDAKNEATRRTIPGVAWKEEKRAA